MTPRKPDFVSEGQRRGAEDDQVWRASLMDTPEKQASSEAIAAEQDLWLQLVEARMAANIEPEELAARMGTTKAQVKRIEKNSYSYRLSTLRRYVQALGEGFSLEVRIHQPKNDHLSEANELSPASPQ